MLDQLLSIIPGGNIRHPIAWDRLIDTVSTRLNIAKSRFMSTKSVRTPLVELLRWMVLNFNEAEADNCPNDITRLTTVFQSYQNEFKVAFDPIWTRTLSANKLFVDNTKKNKVVEIFLNSSISDMSSYPLDEGWSSWMGERAVRILYYNSTTLPISMLTGYVAFGNKSPSYAVISINVQTLLMKWYKYKKFCIEDNKAPDATEFIVTSEFSNFFDDFLDIWTTNLILTNLSNPDVSSDVIAKEVFVPGFITTDNILSNGISGLKEVLKLIKSRNLKLQDLLDTHWYRNGSIRERITDIESNIILPDLRQYMWLNTLKVIPYLRMIVAMLSQDPDNPAYNMLINKAYWIYVNEVKYTQWPNYQYSEILKRYIKTVSDNLEKVFKSDKIVNAMDIAP